VTKPWRLKNDRWSEFLALNLVDLCGGSMKSTNDIDAEVLSDLTDGDLQKIGLYGTASAC
jgi:hypothetical protein